MFETRDRGQARQNEFWVVRDKLPTPVVSAFFRKLDRTLNDIGFAEGVRAICRPAYAEEDAGGRPGIDPAVYFKMLMVGFFENLPSERSIATRCSDSLSLRDFLGYDLAESTPDHSSLSVIRQRLGPELYQAAFDLVLCGLNANGLLKGKDLGVDSSVIEANASLRELQHRNTEEAYWDYVKRLAAEAGIEPADTKAVRRFDKKREGRKTSNEDWVNPHDPDAKVGKTKDGATDMIYKPEHITDLESGVIVRAEVRLGDEGDSEGLAGRVMEACQTLARVCEDPEHRRTGQTLTSDEGYFSVESVCLLQGERVRTVMGDPHRDRRKKDEPCRETRKTLARAKRAVESKSGKALLRKRGEHLERSFAHLLDHGGMRRATLRGKENLTKRHIAAALTYNLSLLMRKLFGHGTPKQWLAAAFLCLWEGFMALLGSLGSFSACRARIPGAIRPESVFNKISRRFGPKIGRNPSFSTGC
jgi:transposase